MKNPIDIVRFLVIRITQIDIVQFFRVQRIRIGFFGIFNLELIQSIRMILLNARAYNKVSIKYHSITVKTTVQN